MGDELDEAVNDILSQIKDHTKGTNEIQKVGEVPHIDEIEDFLVNKTSSLINSSIDMVENVKDYISSAPENRDVASLAELIRASTSAIDTLTKLHTAKESNKSKKEIKQLDIESKEKMNIVDNQAKVLMSRDDVIKALMSEDEDNDDVVDV